MEVRASLKDQWKGLPGSDKTWPPSTGMARGQTTGQGGHGRGELGVWVSNTKTRCDKVTASSSPPSRSWVRTGREQPRDLIKGCWV